MRPLASLLLACLLPAMISAQDLTPSAPPGPKAKSWYDSFSIRGYAHLRYNRLLETNDLLRCQACDASWGRGGGIFLRRARVIISGQVHPRVYLYMQTDFAQGVAPNVQNIAQIRDWYMDIGLDPTNEFRVRLGQSKVPYGFENLQSSSERLPMDRADPTNSGTPNERDLGAFLYWSPKKYRGLFKELKEAGMKGTGDYGIVGIGAYNGQSANRAEANDDLNVVARISVPMRIGSQIIEPGVQAYTGRYTVTADQRSGAKGNSNWTYDDQRVAGTLVLYPKPFGFLAEYNVGKGPEYDVATDSISTKDLSGGFVTATYKLIVKDQMFMPFARYQVYDGGKKNETDARSYSVNDMEFGVEWLPFKNFELTVEYYLGDRRFEDHGLQSNKQKGELLRIQAQFNF
ncbi:MAG: porin [Flavobacteriales bacterium]|nr:porin [Flavobacteriales bacterium]